MVLLVFYDIFKRLFDYKFWDYMIDLMDGKILLWGFIYFFSGKEFKFLCVWLDEMLVEGKIRFFKFFCSVLFFMVDKDVFIEKKGMYEDDF